MKKKSITLIILLVTALSACNPQPERVPPTTTTASTTTEATTTSTTSATTSTSTSTTVVGPVNPSGRFTLLDGKTVDPEGKPFYPIGVNIAVKQGIFETGYTFNFNGTGTGRSSQVQQWGWNTVRATLICRPPGDGPSLSQVNQGLDNFIAGYTAKKIVVMIECHDLTGSDPTPTKATAVTDFIVAAAQRHKDNPYVWYNPYNEPFASESVDGWLALNNYGLSRVRAVAPNSIYVADLAGWGQGVAKMQSDPRVVQFAKDDGSTLLSWHAWGAVGTIEDRAKQSTATIRHREVFEYIKNNEVPVIIGEFGDPLTLDEGTAGWPIWNRTGAYAVMELAPQYGVGLIWWHATGDSGVFLTYTLMQDRRDPWRALPNGTGLSAAGKVFWSISQKQI